MALTINRTPITPKPLVFNTVSGPIASCNNAKAGKAKQVLCSINPVQDLHGYDNPYPAGGGVNKLPPMVDGTYEGNGAKAVVVNGIATLSGTTTSSGNAFRIPLSSAVVVPSNAYYHIMNSAVNGSLAPTIENSNNTSQNISYSFSPANRIQDISGKAGITVDRVRFYIGNNVTLSGTYSPMICLDNTARSYSPYANICPITGFTGLDLYRTGKNLIRIPTGSKTQAGVTWTIDETGNISATGTSTGSSFSPDANSVELQAGTYTASLISTNNSMSATLAKNGAWFRSFSANTSETFTLTEKAVMHMYVYVLSGVNASGTAKIQLELGSTGTTYEPYTGTTYPITWQTEAGTVYGGTVNLTTGKLTVKMWPVDLGSLSYTLSSGRFLSSSGLSAHPAKNSGTTTVPNALSDRYVAKRWNDLSSNSYSFGVATNQIMVCNPNYATANDFKTAMSGVYVIYELANPLEYDLTPTQVQMLLGTNNLWCDTGDTSVTYMTN